MVMTWLMKMDLVMTCFDRHTGLTSWSVGPYSFSWDGATVWLHTGGASLPFLHCEHRELAVQYTVGFFAGRTVPALPGEGRGT